MIVESLNVRDLRILEAAQLELGNGVNIVVGSNGSGKTTVLEALYLLGRGRSFRHLDNSPLVRTGKSSCEVVGTLRDNEFGRHVIGIERAGRGGRTKIDGRMVIRRSELVDACPLVFVGSQCQDLLIGSPDLRRGLLDLGVFHVEPKFREVIFEFGRVHRQRNAALKGGDRSAVRVWDNAYVRLSEAVIGMRDLLLTELDKQLNVLIHRLLPGFRVSVRLAPGWNIDLGLFVHLAQVLEQDIRLGHCTVGAHRCDIVVRVEKTSVGKRLSRGQLKILSLCFFLAIRDLVCLKTGKAPLLLIDDLGSELDIDNQNAVLQTLNSQPGQSVVTIIQTGGVEFSDSNRMFHVKHGAVTA